MKISIICLLFLSLLVQCWASNDTKCENPLLKNVNGRFGPIGLSSPQVYKNLTACKFLNGKPSCCGSETINRFKPDFKELQKSIMKRLGSRDNNIEKTRTYVQDMLDVLLEIDERIFLLEDSAKERNSSYNFTKASEQRKKFWQARKRLICTAENESCENGKGKKQCCKGFTCHKSKCQNLSKIDTNGHNNQNGTCSKDHEKCGHEQGQNKCCQDYECIVPKMYGFGASGKCRKIKVVDDNSTNNTNKSSSNNQSDSSNKSNTTDVSDNSSNTANNSNKSENNDSQNTNETTVSNNSQVANNTDENSKKKSESTNDTQNSNNSSDIEDTENTQDGRMLGRGGSRGGSRSSSSSRSSSYSRGGSRSSSRSSSGGFFGGRSSRSSSSSSRGGSSSFWGGRSSSSSRGGSSSRSSSSSSRGSVISNRGGSSSRSSGSIWGGGSSSRSSRGGSSGGKTESGWGSRSSGSLARRSGSSGSGKSMSQVTRSTKKNGYFTTDTGYGTKYKYSPGYKYSKSKRSSKYYTNYYPVYFTGGRRGCYGEYGYSRGYGRNYDCYNQYDSYYRNDRRNYNYNDMKDVTQKIDNVRFDFRDFQRARARCLIHVLKTATKMSCMACMPNYDKFYQNGTLVFNQKVCDRLIQNCFEFVKRNEIMSQMDNSSVIGERKQQAEKSLVKIKEKSKQLSEQSKIDTNAPVFVEIVDTYANMTSENFGDQKTGRYLRNCSNITNCTSLCDRSFNSSGLDISFIQNPGDTVVEEEKRMLTQSGGVQFSTSKNSVDIDTEIVSDFESEIKVDADPIGINKDLPENRGVFGNVLLWTVSATIMMIIALII